LLAALLCRAAGNPIAARLAREAKKAQNSGQLVRAYMLYSEAAIRDPGNPSYRVNRDAIAPLAHLLTQAHVDQSSDISKDIQAAEDEAEDDDSGPPIEDISVVGLREPSKLQGLPHLQPTSASTRFELRGDLKTLFEQVTRTYGIRAVFDKDLDAGQPIRFAVVDADFRTALESLTVATKTFVFPISATTIFVAKDTEAKRVELEPNIILTVPLPDSVDQKDLTEAANAVRGALSIRTLGFDSAARVVVIRDRVSKARIARSLLEALLLPKPQVALGVQLITLDTDVNYHYGLSLPSSFSIINIATQVGGFQNIISGVAGVAYLPFGGAPMLAVGLTSATLFATYTNAFSRTLYDGTVLAGDGQAASFHVGDKYPIPQSIYSGFQQNQGSSAALYNPIGQVTFEDLGLNLKLTPHITGNGDVSIDMEVEFKSLGTETINTIPVINQRSYKGSVRLEEGQWALVAGIDQSTHTFTRTGWPGLSQIRGLNHIFSENLKDDATSNTLIVIKPQITRLPMSGLVSPEYLIGPAGGARVLL
jgi:general secretion pathway protein D